MTCHECRRAILTAERAELRGEGDAESAGHLRDCPDCRAIAVQLEEETQALARVVTARTCARRRRNRIAWALVPAAAAGITAFLLRPQNPLAPVIPVVVSRPPVRSVSVDVARGQTAAVIRTSDPSITIVWLAPGGSE